MSGKILDELFQRCPVLSEIMVTGRTLSTTGESVDTRGFSTPRNIELLRAIMMDTKPEKTLEIGLAHGGSALAITASHRDLGRKPAQQHVAIDAFQKLWGDGGIFALKRAELIDYIEHIDDISQIALPRLYSDNLKFNLIYIDGSHFFDDVFVDFYYCDKIITEGGHIVFDDCSDIQVRKVVNFIRNNYKEAYEEILPSHYVKTRSPLRDLLLGIAGKRQVTIFKRFSKVYRSVRSKLKKV